jgi:hypothetical protein
VTAAIPYSQCQHAYFIHQGTAYNVASSPSSIFKAWIAATSKSWPDGSAGDALALLENDELDLPARWWLLCLPGSSKQSLQLYGSREMAERAMKSEAVVSV